VEENMPDPYQPSEPNPPKAPQKVPRHLWFWWLIMLGLIVWNLMSFWPQAHPEVNLPYSAFLEQVRQNNVAKVRISGERITGSFKKPIPWPPTSSPAAPAPAAEKAPAKPQMPVQQPPADYGAFLVNFPKDIGDPGLLPLLESHAVEIDVKPPSTPWFAFLLTDGLPILLLVGLFVWIGRQAGRSQAGIFKFARSKAKLYEMDRPKVMFADVAGADEAKADLQEEVDFLRNPQKYHRLGARIPRGVLLVGHPGTGKTLMARAVAGEAGVPFFSISASEFVEMFVGVGASRVRDLFLKAKEAAPAIVFIDELDAVGRRRGAGLGQTNDEREQTLNQLLVEMDGFDERNEVIIIAATNRHDVLDPALLRPGRFDRQVVVGLPDRDAREGILKIHTRPLKLSRDVDLKLLARGTPGLSGADLANLCNEAALNAARNNRLEVKMLDFETALDKVQLGEARPHLQNDRDRRIVAYHESGHAIVAWFSPEADPVHKVTIIPHGRALGVTEQLPLDDQLNFSRSYLQARLAIMLGGRTAEETVLHEITTGAENDLLEATRLARRMVASWGMGELGLAAFRSEEEQPFLGYELARGRDFSESTAALIDENVQRLLQESHDAALKIITEKRDKLDQVVEMMLEKETLDRNDLAEILGPQISETVEEKAGLRTPSPIE
jgi:cell division protease FtsH